MEKIEVEKLVDLSFYYLNFEKIQVWRSYKEFQESFFCLYRVNQKPFTFQENKEKIYAFFPNTERIAKISDFVLNSWNKICKEEPTKQEIKNKFISHWINLCESNNTEEYEIALKEFNKFKAKISKSFHILS